MFLWKAKLFQYLHENLRPCLLIWMWFYFFALFEWLPRYFNEHASFREHKNYSISDLCYCLRHLHTRGHGEVKIKPAGISPQVVSKPPLMKLQWRLLLAVGHAGHLCMQAFAPSSLVFIMHLLCCMYKCTLAHTYAWHMHLHFNIHTL